MASAYFVSMKQPLQVKVARVSTKTAGWQDAPDETGLLEGQFEVPLEFAVQLMGTCAMHLLRLMTAGLIYSKSIRGPYAGEVLRVICDTEWDHKNAFQYLVERMAVLAGAPHIPESEMPPSSTDPLAVAQRMIRAEQEMIQSYHELCAVLGHNPMKFKIKSYMGECQAHLDKYWRALPPEYGNKPMIPTPPVMLERHEENETPEQEAIESPEFQQAEEAAGVEQPGEDEGAEDQELPEGGEDTPQEASEAPSEEAVEEPAPPDQKTASGFSKVAALMAKWAKENATDAELKETGRQRAVTTISAEHHRESARRGERAGRTLGMLGGAAAGGVLGHALGKGHPMATLGGAALGGAAGHRVGGELGTEADIARHKKANIAKLAMRMVRSLTKTADELQGIPDAEAPMASPTDDPELTPVNYLQAEQVGQQFQDRNEANFYRSKLHATEQQVAQAQQEAQMQVQQMQQAAAQAQADAASAAPRIKSALDEAVNAKNDALKQMETASRMRIAQQNLRMQLMELASQDPDAQAAMDLAQSTGQGTPMGTPLGTVPPAAPDAGLNAGPPQPPAQGDSGGGPPGGPAGAAPDAQTAPGAAPPAGSPDMNATAGGPPGPDPSMAQSLTQVGKTASVLRRGLQKHAALGGALLGGLVGGADQAYRTHQGIQGGLDPVQSRIDALMGSQDGSYGSAAALAMAKTQLAQRELALAHPTQAMLRNTGKGAVQGALLGSGIEDKGRQLQRLLTQ